MSGIRRLKSHGITILATLLVLAVFCSDLLIPLGLGTPILYVVPVVLVAVWSPPTAMMAVFAIATLSTILSVAGLFLAPPGHLDLAIGNRILALSAVWFTVIITLLRKGIELDSAVDQAPQSRDRRDDELALRTSLVAGRVTMGLWRRSCRKGHAPVSQLCPAHLPPAR